MSEASQLPGKGSTDVDVAPTLHVNKKSYYDDNDDDGKAALKSLIEQKY